MQNYLPKIYVVKFWHDGCTPVSPGCDNCMAHGPGLVPSINGRAVERLAKLNAKAAALGGPAPLVFVQDSSDAWADHAPEDAAAAMVAAVEAAPALNLVISTRYIHAMLHRAPAHWLGGQWPANLGLMVSVSNQRDAERDIPPLLAMKAKHGIPWVGARCEPMLREIELTKLTLQALAHPRRRGRQYLDALTGHVVGGSSPYTPAAEFGRLDWVTVRGERQWLSGDTARPLHPSWLEAMQRDCTRAGVPLYFRGWGEWLPATEVQRSHSISYAPGHETKRMMIYRHGETTSDYPDTLMEFFKVGYLQADAMFKHQYIAGVPDFDRLRRRPPEGA